MDRLRKHRRAPSDGKYILAPAIRPGARPKMAPQRLVRLLDGMRKLTALVLVLVALAGCSSATMHARTRNLLSFTETMARDAKFANCLSFSPMSRRKPASPGIGKKPG